MKMQRRFVVGICAVAMVGVAVGAWARGRATTKAQAPATTQAKETLGAAGQTATQAPGEAKAKTHVEVPVVVARAEDVGAIEAIVQADYECISGGVGVAPQWGRDFSLYDPKARFFVVTKDAKSGGRKVWAPTLQEFTDETDAEMVKGGFTERELGHKIYRYGNVATVFSSYEGKNSATGEVYGRGVNIYQVYHADGRWWISSVSWDAEREINEIPAELQPGK